MSNDLTKEERVEYSQLDEAREYVLHLREAGMPGFSVVEDLIALVERLQRPSEPLSTPCCMDFANCQQACAPLVTELRRKLNATEPYRYYCRNCDCPQCGNTRPRESLETSGEHCSNCGAAGIFDSERNCYQCSNCVNAWKPKNTKGEQS